MKVGLGNLRCAAGAQAEAEPKPEGAVRQVMVVILSPLPRELLGD